MKKLLLFIFMFFVMPLIIVADEIEVGDFISLTPDLDSYSISGSQTGYSTQTINPSELNLWRVININDDGSIDAISHFASSKGITFSGITGYKNYVSALQELASAYAIEGYTQSTRMFGYNGQTLVLSDTSALNASNNNFYTTSTPAATDNIGEEYAGGVFGDSLYKRDYLLVYSVYNKCRAYKVGTSDYVSIWVASRYYYYHNIDGSIDFYFNGYSIANDPFMVERAGLRGYNTNRWYSYNVSKSIRPIITLKPDVKIATGSGSQDEPYTLRLLSKNNILIENVDNGTINIDNNTDIEEESVVTFNIVANTGYYLESLSIVDSNNNVIDYDVNENDFSFVMPGTNVTIIPVFQKVKSVIEYVDDENVGIQFINTEDLNNVSFGTNVIFSVDLSDFYEFEEIEITDENGNIIDYQKNDNGEYSFIMPDSNVNIKPIYKKVDKPVEEPVVVGIENPNTIDKIIVYVFILLLSFGIFIFLFRNKKTE